MKRFQNVGTFDAGVITSSGGAMPGGNAMTMDAAGIASGMAFLTSELEKRDPLIRKPLTSVTYPRDIVVKSGGGWVDYVSAQAVGYGITGGSGSGPLQAGGSNGLPIVQANLEKGLYKAHTFAAALRVMWVDMQKANYIGRSLDQLLQEGMRTAYDKHMDQNVYTGMEEYGSTGLVNNPDVAETSVTGGTWATKTKEQILADINGALTSVWEAAEYDEDAMPNHILLPYEQYTYIMNTMVTDLATETILDYVLKNNVATKNGKSLYIGAARWCKGAGTGGTDRMVVYVNHERFLQVEELVPLARVMSQPNATEFCYDTAYAANLSEVELFYPQTMQYFDGI
mgnify:CR=1 FL=1